MSDMRSARASRLPESSALLLIVGLTSGCTHITGYRDPISTFRGATAEVVTSSRAYLTEMNKVMRDSYIDLQATRLEPIDPSRTYDEIFSPKGVELRLKALSALGRYAELLDSIANSDAPDKIGKEAQALGDAVAKLGGDVQGLPAGANDSFKQGVGVFSRFFAQFAALAVQKEMENALNKAIADGQNTVEGLTAALKKDLSAAFELRRSALSQRWNAAVDAYNLQLKGGKSPDPAELRRAAAELKTSLDAIDRLVTANPADTMDAFSAAHEALVKYAKSKKKAEDLAALSDAMLAFAARAKAAGELAAWTYKHRPE